jgi:aspartyl-tRNA synthetase
MFADDKDYMAGALIFEAPTGDLAATKKALKDAEEDTRLGMRDHLEQFCNSHGCLFSSLLRDSGGSLHNSVLKKCPMETAAQLSAALSATGTSSGAAGGFLAFGPRKFVLPLLGRLRNTLARSLVPDLDTRGDSFAWVVDFPLFLIGALN